MSRPFYSDAKKAKNVSFFFFFLLLRVVHGSISCDPTQPNTANNEAYSLVVTYFYTQNLSVSRTCQIGRKIKFNCLVKPNLI